MDKIFDKLPYDFLAGVKPLYITLAAVALGLSLVVVYYFVGYGPVQDEYAALEKTKTQTEATLKNYQVTVAQKPFITGSRPFVHVESQRAIEAHHRLGVPHRRRDVVEPADRT